MCEREKGVDDRRTTLTKIGFNRSCTFELSLKGEKSPALSGLAGSHLGNYRIPWETIPERSPTESQKGPRKFSRRNLSE